MKQERFKYNNITMSILWIIFLVFITYFFYSRIWVVYSKIHYYQKQGVKFHSGIYPILGSYFKLIQSKNEPLKGGSLITNFVNNTYFPEGKDVRPFVGVVFGTTVALYVNLPEATEEIFITKNKYFDKHPRSARLLQRFFG